MATIRKNGKNGNKFTIKADKNESWSLEVIGSEYILDRYNGSGDATINIILGGKKNIKNYASEKYVTIVMKSTLNGCSECTMLDIIPSFFAIFSKNIIQDSDTDFSFKSIDKTETINVISSDDNWYLLDSSKNKITSNKIQGTQYTISKESNSTIVITKGDPNSENKYDSFDFYVKNFTQDISYHITIGAANASNLFAIHVEDAINKNVIKINPINDNSSSDYEILIY